MYCSSEELRSNLWNQSSYLTAYGHVNALGDIETTERKIIINIKDNKKNLKSNLDGETLQNMEIITCNGFLFKSNSVTRKPAFLVGW